MKNFNSIQLAHLELFLRHRTIEQAAYIVNMADQNRRDKVPSDIDFDCAIIIRDNFDNRIPHGFVTLADESFETCVRNAYEELVPKPTKPTFVDKIKSFFNI